MQASSQTRPRATREPTPGHGTGRTGPSSVPPRVRPDHVKALAWSRRMTVSSFSAVTSATWLTTPTHGRGTAPHGLALTAIEDLPGEAARRLPGTRPAAR